MNFIFNSANLSEMWCGKLAASWSVSRTGNIASAGAGAGASAGTGTRTGIGQLLQLEGGWRLHRCSCFQIAAR